VERVPASVEPTARAAAAPERAALKPGIDPTKWAIYPALGATLLFFVLPLAVMIVGRKNLILVSDLREAPQI
jgi:hypothetical protein